MIASFIYLGYFHKAHRLYVQSRKSGIRILPETTALIIRQAFDASPNYQRPSLINYRNILRNHNSTNTVDGECDTSSLDDHANTTGSEHIINQKNPDRHLVIAYGSSILRYRAFAYKFRSPRIYAEAISNSRKIPVKIFYRKLMDHLYQEYRNRIPMYNRMQLTLSCSMYNHLIHWHAEDNVDQAVLILENAIRDGVIPSLPACFALAIALKEKGKLKLDTLPWSHRLPEIISGQKRTKITAVEEPNENDALEENHLNGYMLDLNKTPVQERIHDYKYLYIVEKRIVASVLAVKLGRSLQYIRNQQNLLHMHPPNAELMPLIIRHCLLNKLWQALTKYSQ